MFNQGTLLVSGCTAETNWRQKCFCKLTLNWLQSLVSRAVSVASFGSNKEIKTKSEGDRERGSWLHIHTCTKLLKWAPDSFWKCPERRGRMISVCVFIPAFSFVVCNILFFILGCFSSLLSPCCCLHLIHSKVLITSRIHNHPKIFNRNIKYLHVKDCQTEWVTCVTLLETVPLRRAWIVPWYSIVCFQMSAVGREWGRP